MNTDNTTGDNDSGRAAFDPDKMDWLDYCIAVKKSTEEQIKQLRVATGLLRAMASERNSRNTQELINLTKLFMGIDPDGKK